MGADLCGYLLVGPKSLNSRKVEKASKKMASYLEQLRQLRDGKIEKLIVPDVESSSGKAYMTIKVTDLDEGNEFVETLEEAPEDLVSQFVELWEGDGYRDLARRDLPAGLGKNMQAIFAGTMTWGDGPEPDSAWGICEMMDKLGLLELVGVL